MWDGIVFLFWVLVIGCVAIAGLAWVIDFMSARSRITQQVVGSVVGLTILMGVVSGLVVLLGHEIRWW